MGNKRKSDNCDEKIRKKIRKLEEKLSKKKRIRRLPSSSSDDENSVTPQLVATTSTPPTVDEVIACTSDYPLSPNMTTAALPEPDNTQPAVPTSATDVEVELDESILSLLGDAPQNEVELGPPVHKDIASRWQDIILKGLSEENKKKLLNDYVIPANLDKLIPPILNTEVKAALPDTLIKRDFSLQQRQKQIAISLSALGKSIDILLTEKTLPQTALKSLSDACRLLCDTFFNETRIRRLFIVNAINIQMKNAIIDTIPGKYLFGENIGDKLKAAQNIKKSADILKPVSKQIFNKNNFVRSGPSSGNFNRNLNQRGPYRRMTVRPDMGQLRPQPRTALASPMPPTSSARGRGRRRTSPLPTRNRYTSQNQQRR